jgi:hypothetical protein
MAVSLTSVIAEIEAAVGDADKAVPALQVVVKVVDEVKPLLPSDEQAYATDAVTVLNGLIAVLSKV